MLVQAQEDTLSGNGLGVLQLHVDLDMPKSMKADQLRILALNAPLSTLRALMLKRPYALHKIAQMLRSGFNGT